MVCALWVSGKKKRNEVKKVHVFKTTAIWADGVSQQSHHHGRDMGFFNDICYFIRIDILLYNVVDFLAKIKPMNMMNFLGITYMHFH